MEQPTQGVFPGFEYVNSESGFTQIGNKNFALLAHIDNLSEMKVILYLMRNTWGYQEYEQGKLITTEEFVNGRKRKDTTRLDSGCGLKTTAVKEGLARGIEHGYILCTVDDSDKGRIKKYYRLKMDEASKPNMDELDGRNTTMPGHNATMDSRKATSKESQSDHRSEKETLETNIKKQTKKKGESASVSLPHPVWSLWRNSIGRIAKDAPIERDLNYCLELEEMCKEAKIDLTIELIHQRRDQFKQNNVGKSGWYLGNLVTEMRAHIDGLQPAQPGQDLSEKVLWTRYSHLPNFEASVDLWFLFEHMTRTEAIKYGITGYGEMSSRKVWIIENRLSESDKATRRGLIEQWINEQSDVAVGAAERLRLL